jgi:hypothetical protein
MKLELYIDEAKIGFIVWLANIVTAIIIALIAGVLAVIGIGSGIIKVAQGTDFNYQELVGVGIVVLIVLVILLYISFVIRGIVTKKALEISKVKI